LFESLQRQPNWLERQLGRRHGPRILTSAGLLLTIVGPFFWGEQPLLSIVSIVIGVGAIAVADNLNEQRRARAEELEREVDRLRKQNVALQIDPVEVMRNHLMISAERLQFTEAERISLYKHEAGAFVLLGRFSRSSEFSKRGRPVYPADQGCIRDAWRTGEGRAQLPDFSRDPDLYLRTCEQRFNMPAHVVENLAMKSRNVFATKLFDLANRTPIAVMVFESMRSRGIRAEAARSEMEFEKRRFAYLMDVLKPIEPSPAEGKREGF